MNWVAIIGTMLAGLAAGYSDREVVERLSADDRARLDELFGSADSFIASLRESGLAEQAGVPQLDFAGGFAAPPQLSEDLLGTQLNVLGPGGQTLSGTVGGGAGGRYVLNVPGYAPIQLSQSDGGIQAQFAGDENGAFATSEIGFSPEDVFRNVFDELRAGVPETPSVMQGVEIPDFDLDRLINEWETRFGGLLERGDLVSRYVPAGGQVGERALIPEFPEINFDAARAALRERLTADTGAAAEQESSTARRGLIEAGVLPGSAAFEFETMQAPRARAATATAQGISQIDTDLEEAERELGFRRAEIEQTGLSDAARINADIAATDANNLARLLGVEEETIANQFGSIAGAFGQDVGFGLQGAQLQLDANQQDIANDFQAWGAQFGVTEQQLEQFNTFLAQNTTLTTAEQSIIAELMKAEMMAELEQADSTVLSNDILQNALGLGMAARGFFQDLDPDRSRGGGFSILGTGLNWSS